ncbi:hypothetical protein GF314_15850 [bacterium]|nr:hypothetical protein [bacterium]
MNLLFRSWQPRLPMLVALALILLAAAALFWPTASARRDQGNLLVLLPRADARRVEALDRLTRTLVEAATVDLALAVVTTPTAFDEHLDRALVAVVPDGLALGLDPESWQPLAAGRRRVPWNLRPAATLVSRASVPAADRPWLSTPGRTVFGDSLSLVCRAAWCDGDGAARPDGVGWGSDPYDHRPVLVALRHGAYDHAVVRQWDAEAAVAEGCLPPDRWRLTTLSDPVPDVVVLASRRLPTGVRLELQQALTVVGRQLDRRRDGDPALVAGLGLLGLDGFNLLLTPEFDRLRRQYEPCWPDTAP